MMEQGVPDILLKREKIHQLLLLFSCGDTPAPQRMWNIGDATLGTTELPRDRKILEIALLPRSPSSQLPLLSSDGEEAPWLPQGAGKSRR